MTPIEPGKHINGYEVIQFISNKHTTLGRFYEVKCTKCGKISYVRASRIATIKCKYCYKNQTHKKQSTPLRKEALALWAKVIKLRANYKCEFCGATTNLDAHHWACTKANHGMTDYMLINGICLCRNCHIWCHNHVKEAYDKCYEVTKKYYQGTQKSGYTYEEEVELLKQLRNIIMPTEKLEEQVFAYKVLLS